jgi:hypothetical protein
MSRVFSLVMLGASILAIGVAMVLGTSEAVPYIGHTWPFLNYDGDPSTFTVTFLTWFFAVAAGGGTLLGLYAVRRGPFVSPLRLVIAGAVVACLFAMLPPAGSVDMLNYAIYGRIADLGRDPYVTTPLRLAHTGDPVGVLMPPGWQRVPTVYGPITTTIQYLAAHVAGNSMARIIFLLKWANAVAFIGTGVILDRLVGPDPVRRVRACLLWTANPIMLFWMIGSGHADVYAVFFLVAALYALRRSALAGGPAGSLVWAFVGGMAGGAAVAVKASFLFPAAGLVAIAWFGAVRIRRTIAVIGGILFVAGGGYLAAGPEAIHSLSSRLGRTKDRYLPVPSFILDHHVLYTVWWTVLGLGAIAFLWWRSGLPIRFWRRPQVPSALPLEVLPVVVIAFGTTLLSPLQYPWYDAMVLPLLAVLPLKPYARLDRLIIIRGVLIALMTLPGVRVNGYQHLGVRWVNLVWLIVFLVYVWRETRSRESTPDSGPEVDRPVGESSPAPA